LKVENEQQTANIQHRCKYSDICSHRRNIIYSVHFQSRFSQWHSIEQILLVLRFYGIAICCLYSCGDNQMQGKIAFQVARFIDTAVLRFRCPDNFASYRQTDKQMPVADICGDVLLLFADISYG
jgi:hypothetical protein